MDRQLVPVRALLTDVVSSTGCLVVDARIRVAPALRTDPFLGQLRRTR